MPLKWHRKQNPFIHTHFGRLRIGPNANRKQINDTAAELKKKLGAGHKVTMEGVDLDEFAVDDASKRLLDPRTLAHELLLTHPLPRDDGKKIKTICEQLRKIGILPEARGRLPLTHPVAVFWFTPLPGTEALPAPQWADFATVEAGAEGDLELDCFFDI